MPSGSTPKAELSDGIFYRQCQWDMVYIDPDIIPDNVETIKITGNPISAIPARTFASKGSCRFLYLAYNEIHTLDTQAFGFLTALEELYLNHNLIKELKKGTFDMISTNPKLKKIDLQDNFLSTLPSGLFSEVMSSLQELNLRNNPLVTIPYDLASIPMEGIDESKLEVNSWYSHTVYYSISERC